MKKTMVIAALLALVSVTSAFAAKKKSSGPNMYVRGSLGYAAWSVEGEGVSHFSIEPVFGVTNLFPVEGLGFEGFVDCNFGGEDFGYIDISSKIFAPGARVMYARSIGSYMGDKGVLSHMVPYVGAGFCVPIVNWSYDITGWNYNPITGNTETTKMKVSNTEAYFAMDTVYGFAFTFTDQFAAHAELGLRFGGIFDFSFRLGGAFKFK